MNTLEIDSIEKNIPTPDRCLRESMPETEYPDY